MIDQIVAAARDKMRKAIDVTSQDLSGIRSGRATPSLVENLMITAYEGTQSLKLREMATITTMDSKTIMIAPYDPSVITDIEKSIQHANIGLTPVVDGKIIRITIPLLSEERRIEYVKLARTKLEYGRVMIRQVRHDAMKELRKAEDENVISEDERTVGEKKVQDATDELIAELDGMGKRKEEELMQV